MDRVLLNTLLKVLERENSDTCWFSATHLRTGSIPELVEKLQDEDFGVRSLAAISLGGIGAGAKGAVTELRAALEDEDAEVRRAAALALGRIDLILSSEILAEKSLNQ